MRFELTISGWKPDVLPLALRQHLLERVPRIELGISAWQADVLPLAPYPHLLVRVAGFEPALPPSKGGGWTRLSYTLLVEPRGIEPRIPACKAGVFPLALRPLCFCLYYICILTHISGKVKHFFQLSRFFCSDIWMKYIYHSPSPSFVYNKYYYSGHETTNHHIDQKRLEDMA